jgi:DNA-binding beta-propeller fold protein YncE
MKKYIIISMLIAIFVIVGGYFYYTYSYQVPCCGSEPVVTDAVIDSNYVFEVQDNYKEGAMVATRQVVFEKTAVYEMNDYLGFPEGNTLKTHSTCYDESIGQGYIAGIMSSEVAVFKDDKVFAYADTGIGDGDFEIKEVYCGDGKVIVVSENEFVKIDGLTLEASSSVKFDPKVHAQSVYASFDFELAAFAVPDNQSYVFYDLNTMDEVSEIFVNRGKMFYRDDGTFLVIDTISNKAGYEVKNIGKDFVEENSYLIDSTFEAVDMVYDEKNNDLWVLIDDGKILIFDLDNYSEKPFVVESEVPDPNAIVFDPEYTVVMTENGYDYDGYGDFLGGIVIIDSVSREILNIVKIPTHHTSIELDEVANMAYITNNGDNSVSRVNLETGEIEAVVEAGSSTESGAVASDGSLYLRNRLGGNSIMHFDPETGEFSNIECEYPWPVEIAYSLNLNKIFTFDFLNSSISVINPDTDDIEVVYDLPVPDGASDAIGDMAYDYTRDVAYVSIPEQNIVVVVNMVTGETIRVVAVEDYLLDGVYGTLGGAGELVLATYEPTAKLLVYAKEVSKIFVYDGLNDFELVATIEVGDIDIDIRNFPYSLVVDQMYDQIYIGSKIYDAVTYELIGNLAYGNSVAWVDWYDGILFTASVNNKDNDQETLYALNYDGEILDQIDLASNQYVKARFAYDYTKGVMYVFYMVSSEVFEIRVEK